MKLVARPVSASFVVKSVVMKTTGRALLRFEQLSGRPFRAQYLFYNLIRRPLGWFFFFVDVIAASIAHL